MKTIETLTVRRLYEDTWEWLICNGMNMGRWTRHFGANCLADTTDCKNFAKNTYAMAQETGAQVVMERVYITYTDPN